MKIVFFLLQTVPHFHGGGHICQLYVLLNPPAGYMQYNAGHHRTDDNPHGFVSTKQ